MNSRRAFLKTLAGAAVAPLVPVPSAVDPVAVNTSSRDHAVDGLRYLLLRESDGKLVLHRYRATAAGMITYLGPELAPDKPARGFSADLQLSEVGEL